MYLHNSHATLGDACSVPNAEPADDPDAALVAYAGDVTGKHILILGHGTPAIICTLIRSGCIAATELRQTDRPEALTADLTIVPDVATLDAAAVAILHGRRALRPAGRIVLRTAAEPSGNLGQGISSLLRLQGFSAVRRRDYGGRILVSADLPFFGPLVHA